MKNSIRLFVLFIFFFQILKGQNFSFKEIPEWVKTVKIPEKSSISNYDILSGFYLTLADYQINLEEDVTFNHEVINVLSYGGITNASQLSITYDTSFQKLQIHHLYIWRKGEKIDRTKDLSFEILNNENNLQQGIYTGHITAYDILNDIRKDDLIDFAFSLVGHNPIFENEKYLFIPIEAMNPIDLFSIRVKYLKEKEYTYECVGCDSLVENQEINGYREIIVQSENVPAMNYEDHIPTWSIPFKYFTLTSFKSWRDVNRWAQNVFALHETPLLETVFNEIFTGAENTEEKINKIINYVQDDIRYMGIESGIGSIKPFPPDQVIKQRFGDCKDKSLLLVHLLKKIGIEKAYPVLVNTSLKHEIGNHGPSNEIFNHCIVTFNYNDTSYWVDPTLALQGGDFKKLFTTDYGEALIIGMTTDTLPNMSPGNRESFANVVDEYFITSFTEPAKLTIVSDRYGNEADNRRTLLEYYTTKDIAEQVTNELKRLFPIVNETEKLKISDDIINNKFSVKYNYEVNDFWQDGNKGTNAAAFGYWIFRYEPLTLYQYLNITACEERKLDYELNYPLNLNYRVVFHFPKDILIFDDYDEFDNKAFFYQEKVEQLSSNSFQIEYCLRTKSNCLKAADYKEMCEQKNTIAKGLPVVIYFSK